MWIALASLLIHQAAGGYSAEPSKPVPETVVHGVRDSPEETQDRVFAGSRFWRLDTGRYEVETWWTHDFNRAGSTDALWQLEIEIGLAPHLQLDLYENFNAWPDFSVEGTQVELRYAFGRSYNAIPLNPVLYLEWHPRHGAPDRAEVRLLMGGDVGSRGLWAANLYGETNVEGSSTDAEAGATAAISFAVVERWLRLGAELKAGVDQHGGPTFKPVTMLGPNALLRAGPFKLTVTAFFGCFRDDPSLTVLAIAGYAF